jgi:hypothetical protein
MFKKILLTTILLLFVSAFSLSQFSITEIKLKGGNYPKIVCSDIDSATTQTSNYFDISQIDNQTLYFCGYYSSTANDSLQVIFQMSADNSAIVGAATDTIFMKALNNYNTAFTFTYTMPLMRVLVIPYNYTGAANNGDVTDGGTLTFVIYGKEYDAIYERSSYQLQLGK